LGFCTVPKRSFWFGAIPNAPTMQYNEIVKKLKSLSNPKNVAGMARFGINPKNTLGVAIPKLRALAKKVGKNAKLAQKLWDSKIHEARILAGMIDDAANVSEKEMDRWVRDFDSWDVCDQVCMNFFRYAKEAPKKCFEWAGKKDEFVKRAGFALMAALAFAKNDMADAEFKKFLPIIKRESTDERNYVRKAVNWALRQIGKRNKNLNKEAIKIAREILKINNKAAKWIAQDAIRELTSEAVQKRLK
jgi:3-methyladenine DNA glycosylase AlkD